MCRAQALIKNLSRSVLVPFSHALSERISSFKVPVCVSNLYKQPPPLVSHYATHPVLRAPADCTRISDGSAQLRVPASSSSRSHRWPSVSFLLIRLSFLYRFLLQRLGHVGMQSFFSINDFFCPCSASASFSARFRAESLEKKNGCFGIWPSVTGVKSGMSREK